MKTKLVSFGHDCWEMLTEVPGWPDAPRQVRLRRALPIFIPCAVLLLLLTWNKFVRDPHLQGERAVHQTLLAQEKEIDALRLSVSEQRAGELSARAVQVEQQILKDPKALGPVLDGLKKQAAELHWDGSFLPSDLSTGTAAPDTQLAFIPVRAKLTSVATNLEAFSALIAILDQFSRSEKRIDLTRLAIRADEQGRYTAELNLRLVARSAHEKTP